MSLVDNVPYSASRALTIGGESIQGSDASTGGKKQSYNVTHDTAGAKTVAITFDHTKVQAVGIGCDQAITSISFTGTTGPLVTPALPAGGAWMWSASAGSEPFLANCTAIVVTLAAFPSGVTAATLKVLVSESV